MGFNTIHSFRCRCRSQCEQAFTGDTFDFFDGHCDGKNGLHNHFAFSVMESVTESLGMNKP